MSSFIFFLTRFGSQSPLCRRLLRRHVNWADLEGQTKENEQSSGGKRKTFHFLKLPSGPFSWLWMGSKTPKLKFCGGFTALLDCAYWFKTITAEFGLKHIWSFIFSFMFKTIKTADEEERQEDELKAWRLSGISADDHAWGSVTRRVSAIRQKRHGVSGENVLLPHTAISTTQLLSEHVARGIKTTLWFCSELLVLMPVCTGQSGGPQWL